MDTACRIKEEEDMVIRRAGVPAAEENHPRLTITAGRPLLAEAADAPIRPAAAGRASRLNLPLLLLRRGTIYPAGGWGD
jgi:hypothetical protein